MQLKLTDLFKFVAFCCLNISSWSILMPATIVSLSNQGYSNSLVGFFSALPPLIMLLTVIWLNKIRQLISLKKAYLLAIFLSLVANIGFVLTSNFYLWCFYNLILGLCGSILWVVGESFIAENAPIDQKGKYIGIFETMMGAAYASGPVIAKIFELSASQSIDISLLIRFLSLVALLFVTFEITTSASTSDKEQKIVSKHLVQKYSYIIFAAFLAGLYETGSGAVASLYSISLNFLETTAILAPGIIGFGSLLMQYPLGVVSDKTSTVKILNICFVLLIIACFALFFVHKFNVIIWPILFIWGAFGGGLYTIAIVEVGKRLNKQNILSATAYVVIFYNIGAIIGPSFGGIALDISKTYGIALFYSVLTVIIYLLFLKITRTQAK